ncbi:MAG: SRPBCC domain-containing protein [Paracoccaceae bacterium]
MTEENRLLSVNGSLRDLGGGKGAVRMESLYPTDPDDLWSALTNAERLARWIAKVEGDLRLHGTFAASFTSGWTGDGRVEECEPPHRLLLSMMPGTDDETVIEARLTVEGDATRLVIEERGIPLAEIGAHGAGWQAHTEDLQRYLRWSQPSNWQRRWKELKPHYESIASVL